MLILYALIRCKSYLRFVRVYYSRADSTYNALRLEDIASYLNTVFFSLFFFCRYSHDRSEIRFLITRLEANVASKRLVAIFRRDFVLSEKSWRFPRKDRVSANERRTGSPVFRDETVGSAWRARDTVRRDKIMEQRQ